MLQKKRKKMLLILVAMFLFLFIFMPSANAKEPSTDSLEHGGNSLDQEINKPSSEIRNEIDSDTKKQGGKYKENNLGIKEGAKGDLYHAHKKAFDKWEDDVPGGGVFVDLIKKLNYTKGKFECGHFDVLCNVVNIGYVTGGSIIGALLDPISKLAITPEKILDDNNLNKFKESFSTFTNSLLAVFILFQLMKIYSYRMVNHSDTINVLNEKIVKIAFACIFLFSYDLVFRFILAIQYRVNYGIFDYISQSKELTNNIMLNLLLTPNGTLFIILILIYAVLLGILFIQMLYTFALVGVFFVVGPVAVVTMVNDEYNMFSMWLRTIISRFLTLALQGLCVVLCFSFASDISFVIEGDGTAFFMKKITSIAFLMVGLAIPSLLKEFGNSSGSGRGAISGVKTVTRMFRR
ncbi:hypothetical protein EV207_1253 [Scopulibacillus darangshiensis]|uniref:TrbL/VirB6 plasmid conjugal transfer protein n=1 Tax=Scopulibacillus darangshiensis TaxID=442528 RepID=A0A4R2NRA8_9BACL|nr:conjugal transfer protein TrbL family protein [Scopulibacillus darangshiensis]TCP24443.1 hypothetical protein EV207_1253 [Scopulibacillus darangshiensis]